MMPQINEYYQHQDRNSRNYSSCKKEDDVSMNGDNSIFDNNSSSIFADENGPVGNREAPVRVGIKVLTNLSSSSFAAIGSDHQEKQILLPSNAASVSSSSHQQQKQALIGTSTTTTTSNRGGGCSDDNDDGNKFTSAMDHSFASTVNSDIVKVENEDEDEKPNDNGEEVVSPRITSLFPTLFGTGQSQNGNKEVVATDTATTEPGGPIKRHLLPLIGNGRSNTNTGRPRKLDDIDEYELLEKRYKLEILEADRDYKRMLVFEKKTELSIPAQLELDGIVYTNGLQ